MGEQVSDIQVKSDVYFGTGGFRGPMNAYEGIKMVFGHTSLKWSKLQNSMYVILLCKIIWGAVSLGTLSDNNEIEKRAFQD